MHKADVLHCTHTHKKHSHFQCNEEKIYVAKNALHRVCSVRQHSVHGIHFIWHEANERRLRIRREHATHAKLHHEGQKSMNFAQHSHWTDPIYSNGFWSILARMRNKFAWFAWRENNDFHKNRRKSVGQQCTHILCLGLWTTLSSSSSSPSHSWHISAEDDVHVDNWKEEKKIQRNWIHNKMCARVGSVRLGCRSFVSFFIIWIPRITRTWKWKCVDRTWFYIFLHSNLLPTYAIHCDLIWVFQRIHFVGRRTIIRMQVSGNRIRFISIIKAICDC